MKEDLSLQKQDIIQVTQLNDNKSKEKKRY